MDFLKYQNMIILMFPSSQMQKIFMKAMDKLTANIVSSNFIYQKQLILDLTNANIKK